MTPNSRSSEEDLDPVVVSAGLWRERGVERVEVMLASSSLERASKLLDAKIEHLLRPFKITFSRFVVLGRLYWTESGSMTLGTIASNLVVHPTSVTSAVDRLERDGLVKRVPHPTDRRATLAQITPAGEAIVRDVTEHLTQTDFGFSGVDRATLAELTLVLRRARAALGDSVADEATYLSLLRVGRRSAKR